MKKNKNLKLYLNYFVFVTLFSFSSFAKEPFVVGQMYSIPSVEIGASQELVGNSAVMQMLDSWAKEAKGDVEVFKKIVASQNSVPAILAPSLQSGSTSSMQFIITDGHHRASAINRLVYADFSSLPENVRKILKNPTVQSALRHDPSLYVKLDLTAIYKTKEETIVGLAKKGKGLLSQETIESTPGLKQARKMFEKGVGKPSDIEALKKGYEHLPNSLGQLKDSPLRSAIGNAFFQAGLNADHFNDYIEFYVGDYLQKRGIKFSLKDPLSKATTEALFRDIFEDDKVVKLLRGQLRPGSEARGLENLALAQKKVKEYLMDAKKIDVLKSKSNCLSVILKQIVR